jgi:hypothetical protein
MGASAAPSITRSVASDPPVRVWFNSDGDYRYGDRAKVYAQAAEDGHLIVLSADPDGRVRVLFPIDPDKDQALRGGKKYELKGRGGREAFVVDDTTGHGTVLAAFAKTPFQFGQFEKNGHWDYSALDDHGVQANPEAGLMDLVQRMQGTGDHFEYDVATYTVAAPPRYVGWVSPYWWDPWYGPRVGLGFRFGWPYYGRVFVGPGWHR